VDDRDLCCPVCNQLAAVDPRDGCCLDCLRRKAAAADGLATALTEAVAVLADLREPADFQAAARLDRFDAALEAYRPVPQRE
jgi:hypothetical protein